MKLTIRLGCLLALGLALLATSTARADETSHKKAVVELFGVMKMHKQFETAIDQMLDVQARSNPVLGKMRPTMKRFFNKYMSFDSLKDDMAKIYMESFTEAEIKDLTKFYQSPLGKKLLEKMPDLMKKGSELGVKRVQANQAELQKMIREDLSKM
jgi:hypothetical protein